MGILFFLTEARQYSEFIKMQVIRSQSYVSGEKLYPTTYEYVNCLVVIIGHAPFVETCDQGERF